MQDHVAAGVRPRPCRVPGHAGVRAELSPLSGGLLSRFEVLQTAASRAWQVLGFHEPRSTMLLSKADGKSRSSQRADAVI